MKKIGIIVFITAIIIGIAFAGSFSFGKYSFDFFSFNRGVKGSGELKTETRNIEKFSAIEVGQNIVVEIKIQDSFGVQVEADDNLLEFIRTSVDGDTLKISTDKKIKTSNPITVRIGAPNINKIEASGVSKVLVADLNNEAFKVEISGASRVDINGTTKDLVADVSGASKLSAEKLQAENVNVDSSGASKAYVFASNRLDANVSGASKVNYAGSPKEVNKTVSGASSINEN